MLQDGFYKYVKFQGDDKLDCQGIFRIEHGVLSILDDPKKILKHMLEEGPVNQKIEDIMRSVNRNHYAYFVKDDSQELHEKYDGYHDPKTVGDKEVSSVNKLDHLANLLEKESDAEEIDIPDHLVIQSSSHHWDNN